jgi:hypothetical protein
MRRLPIFNLGRRPSAFDPSRTLACLVSWPAQIEVGRRKLCFMALMHGRELRTKMRKYTELVSPAAGIEMRKHTEFARSNFRAL